ncbi:DUF2627 family protein [Effusibacillus lacus]|uniref:DUF2627 domain-containing protein n=1 Tax=Effusibacillus lacus TaxID=1348429 RepID=A0A292YLB6_9BACL|nr:DUF2627 family protein [Effusibacillus lacus]TCS76355.1 uncharacterized protein DUF2627 [Effusibacillus lacus]GAX91897.1 hypothetical protein EFBL_3588 [Effusibacillus lacus]
MLRLVSWIILISIFLLAGYGLNMIRVAVMDNIADPSVIIWWRVLIGSILMVGGLFFLGGFIYYRDKKRGIVRKPAWKIEQEIKKKGRQ